MQDVAFGRPSRITDREDDYRKRRLARALSPARNDAFAMGDQTPDARVRTYADVMKDQQLAREKDNTLQACADDCQCLPSFRHPGATLLSANVMLRTYGRVPSSSSASPDNSMSRSRDCGMTPWGRTAWVEWLMLRPKVRRTSRSSGSGLRSWRPRWRRSPTGRRRPPACRSRPLRSRRARSATSGATAGTRAIRPSARHLTSAERGTSSIAFAEHARSNARSECPTLCPTPQQSVRVVMR